MRRIAIAPCHSPLPVRHFPDKEPEESVMAGRGHKDIFAKDIAWAPGSDPGVQYARFLLDEENAAGSPMVILSTFEPGATVAPHTHGCNYFEYIIEGSQMVGKVNFEKGDVRWAAGGAGYGPIVVGPEGCTVLIVFQEAAKANTIPLGKAKKLAEAEA
jgi:anti-sigma factor ChrR (cupin superfamily)